MIIRESRLTVVDNSGARVVQCINIPGTNNPSVASVGDIITVSVKAVRKQASHGPASGAKGTKKGARVAAGSVRKALIVRTRKSPSGGVSFGDNGVILLNGKGEPLGTRLSGPRASDALHGKQRWKAVARGTHVLER